jgi:hypothetical protein
MNQTYVHLIGEGVTEKNFGKGFLADYLANFSVYVDARCVCTSRNRKKGIKYSGV